MHKAVLYEELEGGRVRCTACKQFCTIAKGHTGICGVRENKDGSLYLLVYGKASAVNIDPVEKKPLFHFQPGTPIFSIGTVGCNFGCTFCQNYDISQATKNLKKHLLKQKKLADMKVEVEKFGHVLPPQKIIDICLGKEIRSIAFTYNEPIIFFEYLFDTAKLAHKKGIKSVLVSNGYESDDALRKLKPYISAMNIGLKSFSNDFYQKMCMAKLQPVLDTIEKVHALGIWIEITTLIIPGKNDSQKELKQIASFIANLDKNIPWHVTAFHPDFEMQDVPPTSQESLYKAYKIGKEAGLHFVYVGNILDVDHATTYCPKCNASLIRRHWHSVEYDDFNDGTCTKCNTVIPGVWD